MLHLTLLLASLVACGGNAGPGDSLPADSAGPDLATCPVLGFAPAQDWLLPETGVPLRSFSDATCSGENDELQRVVDLNGDQAPDLVRLYGCDRETDHGNTHWLVHENRGDGFAEEPVYWSLPAITEPYAFHEWQDGACEAEPDHLFGVEDLTGDHRPDLVVLSDCQPDTAVGTSAWWVFENLGDRFASDPITWSAPADFGEDSWRSLEQDQCRGGGADLYSLGDLDGDDKPELVRFGGCLDTGELDHDGTWLVWRNQGDGFAGEPERWILPTSVPGRWDGFQGQNCKSEDDHLYVSRDMNNDGVLDLVVSSFCNQDEVWDDRWLVFFGNGNGFGEATEWPIPEHRAPGAWQFLLGTDCVLGTDSKGGLVDLDGDELPDLVRYGACWGDTVPRTWTVHRNLGDGFDPEETEWWLPDDPEPNTWATLADLQCDDPQDRLVRILDLSGDHIPDVVETYGCSADSAVGDSVWRVLPGGCL